MTQQPMQCLAYVKRSRSQSRAIERSSAGADAESGIVTDDVLMRIASLIVFPEDRDATTRSSSNAYPLLDCGPTRLHRQHRS